jgi:phage shock protein PspC (stress-responsive transcriptional regulator)
MNEERENEERDPRETEERSRTDDPATAETRAMADDERPRRLVRSSDDRVVAGVSGGLGAYFGVDSLIFRIGFVLSIFFGGLGVLAYLLLAVFVPRDDDPAGARRLGVRVRGGGFWRGVGLLAIGLLIVVALLALAGGAAFAVALGWGVPAALVAIAAGALLILAAFRGGARWLIPPAVAIALGASVAAASDVDFSGGIGERGYRPVTEASIPAGGYRLGVGDLVIDLRELDWRSGDVVELETSVGAGRTVVNVPERVCVSADVHVGAGDTIVAGERNEGLGIDEAIEVGSTATPRLELDADVDLGELRVINSDAAEVSDVDDLHFRGPFDDRGDVDVDTMREAEAKACATR